MRKRQRKKLRKRFPWCLTEYSHYENEFECAYGSAIACDHWSLRALKKIIGKWIDEVTDGK
jgi:hypothetical protein